MVSSNAIISAVLSTTLISFLPNLLLILFPQYANGEGSTSKFLALGQALAAGGLLGDVFLHTIPHAEGQEDVGLYILLGFSIFLVTDMIMRSMGGGHQHHNHQHDGDAVQKGKAKESCEKEDKDHSHHESSKATVLLNLAADALHNFTDGLAIGASFSIASDNSNDIISLLRSRGGLATLSILFHEIPHELGDFAILVKNGWTRNEAIMAQFGTAVAAMVGTIAGLTLTDFAGESLIFVTAGGFVYLAAANILPEILEEECSVRFRLAQIMCFAAGIGFLHAVSYLEGMADGHGHSHHHHEHGHHHHAENRHDHHDHHDHGDEHNHHGHEHRHAHAEL